VGSLRRFRIAVSFLLVFALASVAPAHAVTVVPIKTSKWFEIQPEATTHAGNHLFAWTRTHTPNGWGRGWNVMLSVNGVARQISRRGRFSWPNGFDDVGRLIFQQAYPNRPSDSDLFSWTKGHVALLPAAVNNRRWQYGGDRWGNWLVYGENQFGRATAPWTIVAYDFVTGTKHVLARATDACACTQTGNVSGLLASYRLARHVTVDILSSTPVNVGSTTPPLGYVDDFPFVVDPTPAQPTSEDEVLYWVRTKTGPCGHGVRIMKAPLTNLATPTIVATFRKGAVDSLSVNDANGARKLYFGRQTCARVPAGDIFEIPNA
jgi:hypothetical protein